MRRWVNRRLCDHVAVESGDGASDLYRLQKKKTVRQIRTSSRRKIPTKNLLRVLGKKLAQEIW